MQTQDLATIKYGKDRPIGVFDSGVGGVTVLKEIATLLPFEDLIYYGDSLNAPYGEKTPEEVFELAHRVARHLLNQQVKMLVIACNTATSVAVNRLREMYPEMDIVGMEPAIKKSVNQTPNCRVLVMATSVTLSLEKYKLLQRSLDNQADFVPLECPGLAQRIEQGDLEREDLKIMLHDFLDPYIGRIDRVVLGCTHYPFIRRQISEVLGNVPLIDGGRGTAEQVKRLLERRTLLNERLHDGIITFQSSKNTREELELYEKLFRSFVVRSFE